MKSINDLRKKLKAARSAIPLDQQLRASDQACEHLYKMIRFSHLKNIAAYMPSKGEIDPMPLLALAHAMGKQCYLPVLHPFIEGRLWFAPWTPHCSMHINRFGIAEPAFNPSSRCKPQYLDVVIVPLLGFDKNCHRLGMGGGFYDRSFAFTQQRRVWKNTKLIGFSHDVQQCRSLKRNTWDIVMNAVVTPTKIYQTKKT